MKCNAELNSRQKTVITHLLICKTVKEAAQKAGVRLATVFQGQAKNKGYPTTSYQGEWIGIQRYSNYFCF